LQGFEQSRGEHFGEGSEGSPGIKVVRRDKPLILNAFDRAQYGSRQGAGVNGHGELSTLLGIFDRLGQRLAQQCVPADNPGACGMAGR
jgi:hypothetical protein